MNKQMIRVNDKSLQKISVDFCLFMCYKQFSTGANTMHDDLEIPAFLRRTKSNEKELVVEPEEIARSESSEEESFKKRVFFEAQRRWRDWGANASERLKRRPRLKTFLKEVEDELRHADRIRAIAKEG